MSRRANSINAQGAREGKMRGSQTVAAAALGLLLTSSALQAQRSTGDSFTWQGRMASGTTLEIRNINGPVTVERASGDQAEVIARKQYAANADPSGVVIEAVRTGTGNANALICAMWNPNGQCTERGTNNESQSNVGRGVAVHFTVKLPAGVKAALRTVNGRVEVRGASAEVLANTVNGDVLVQSSGPIRATTVSGNVDATIGSATASQDIELTTVNGSVTASAPSGINALFNASTVNGSIQSDFPITVEGRFGPRNVSATLGNGGRRLHMTTVNGSITLKKE